MIVEPVQRYPKDTVFCKKETLNCRGRIIDLSSPLVMGILNITPDSFYDGGKHVSENEILSQTEKMISEGAAIIDIGAYSSRPGAKNINIEEELNRLIPVLKQVRRNFPEVIISTDTFRSEVARNAIDEGADMINDISAGELDENMFKTIAELKVPYIMMHMRGTPETMTRFTDYEDLMQELILYFSNKIHRLKLMGVSDMIIDPGFGFAKNLEQNYLLLKKLDQLKLFGLPILAGVSRKSMIGKVIGEKPANSLNGTTAANTIALMKGADILRVHDVKEAVEAVAVVRQVVGN